ncbi:MAG: T9SS type A sorting domain-containing protein, partial [Bacteroidetes bacterium]|nr:T9SS type A sorting domain-containing protein [Bacteroidota bacterium]
VGGSTGHYVSVQAISGDANTGTSSLTGGIDKVSTVRYYRVTYTPTAFATIPLDRFDVGYEAADGVGSNNTDLRVAYSTDERATWIGMGQTVADTTFVTDQVIVPDSIVQASRPVLSNSNAVYVALARATGTTTNTLVGTTGIEEGNGVPATFMLGQNYPNPFNPATSIRFGLDKPGFTAVRVYDMLGRLVTTLAEGMMAPGFHTVTWNADGASSGLYFYTLQSGEKMQTRKMLLMK